MEPGMSWIRPVVRALITVLPYLVLASDSAAQPDRGPAQDIPPWKRPLSGEAAARVAKLEQQIAQLRRAGRFAEAIEPAREVAETRTRLQGPDHWQSADARRAVDDLRTIAALPEAGRKATASVEDLDQKAYAERQRGRHADWERIYGEVLETCRKWLGEGHPKTAEMSSKIAFDLYKQGKYSEAEPLCRRALAIRLQALGKGHPDSATGCNDLAFVLDA